MKWVCGLRAADEILTSRCLYEIGVVNISCSLHGFADASSKAYCAVIYFVYKGSLGIRVKLLISKTSVAPLKPQTIPRLELMSGRVLAQVVSTVKIALKEEVNIT